MNDLSETAESERSTVNQYAALQQFLSANMAKRDELLAESEELETDILRIENDLKIFKQKTFLKGERKVENADTGWYEKASYALVMKKTRFRSVRAALGALKDESKNSRHMYELHLRDCFLQAFHKEAKKLLSKRDYAKVVRAAKSVPEQ